MNRRFKQIIFVVAACVLAILAGGQSAPKNAGQVPQIPVAGARYRLVVDDVLSVLVIGFPELSVQATVLPDGMISVPLLQDIEAKGRTTSEIAAEIQSKLEKIVVRPRVTVSVVSRRHRFITVGGQVSHPGQFEFRQGMRVLEAIAQSGGVLPLSDLSRIEVVSDEGTHRTLVLTAPESKVGTEQDPVLHEDDSITVPEALRVNVIGQVATPGPIVYRPNMSVLDALQSAGGIKEDADLPNAAIERSTGKIPLDLDALLRHGDIDFNLKLQPGDSLFVPEARNRVYVFGAVNKPGFYLVKPKDRLLDALDFAGGMTGEADIRNIRYVECGPNHEAVNKVIVNLDDIFKKGDLAKNLPLHPGDVVYVSFRKKTINWIDLLGVLGSLNLIFNGGAKLIH